MKKAKVYVIPLQSEVMGICEQCGTYEELRPYGKGGKKICFDCMIDGGQAAELEAKKQFTKQFK